LIEDREAPIKTIEEWGDTFECNLEFYDDIRALLGKFNSKIEKYRTDKNMCLYRYLDVDTN
jgi:hypothetical protein